MCTYLENIILIITILPQFNIPNSNEVVNFEGHFNSGQKLIETDIKIKKGQQNLLLSGSLKGYDCKIEFSNTLNPYVNFRMNGHFENSHEVSIFYNFY